jgi:hypothetical protein
MFELPLDALSESNSIVTELKGYLASGNHRQGHPRNIIYFAKKKKKK